jgi:hypothetical protein
MKITRRQLAALVAAAPGAARVAAARPQAAAPQSTDRPEPPSEQLRRNVAAVRALAVPAATEPAFSFRAE